MSFRLAHFSDPHRGPVPPLAFGDFFGKRLIGHLNWVKRRAPVHDAALLDRIVSHLREREPDHIAVSGDLVNLGLESEIFRARKWLENIGAPEKVSVVLGNHDAYVSGSFETACAAWREFMGGGDSSEKIAFPYRREIGGGILLLGANSAKATAPFMATGYFLEEQAERLARALEEGARKGLFRIVMIHHTPLERAAPHHARLIGAKLFRDVIKTYGAELILHGHTHKSDFSTLPGPEKETNIIGASCASQKPMPLRPHTHPAQYNLFDIKKEAEGGWGGWGGWFCRFRRFGVLAPGAEISKIADCELRI